MLEFDAETARTLEIAYQGADVTRRRRANFDALAPRAGEHILDIGCGNGLLTLELARAVGARGRVTGIDPSAEMRALAADRVAAFPSAEIVAGTADALPVADGAADRAVAVQVYEYLDRAAIATALAETRRALRPGGRLVVGDMHWDGLVWASDEPARMAAVLEVWDRHLAERCVPEHLPALLETAGFETEGMIPVPFCDTRLAPDGLAAMMLVVIERYVTGTGEIAPDTARAWAAEQAARAAEGRFFFAFTHFVAVARRH